MLIESGFLCAYNCGQFDDGICSASLGFGFLVARFSKGESGDTKTPKTWLLNGRVSLHVVLRNSPLSHFPHFILSVGEFSTVTLYLFSSFLCIFEGRGCTLRAGPEGNRCVRNGRKRGSLCCVTNERDESVYIKTRRSIIWCSGIVVIPPPRFVCVYAAPDKSGLDCCPSSALI